MVLDYALTLAPRWVPIVVNPMKNHTNNNLMFGASYNQATNIKLDNN